MEKIQAEVPKLNREQINFFLNLNNPEEKQKLEELVAYREKNAYKSTPLAARALLFENLDTYEEMQDLRRKNEEANAKMTEANIKYADATSRNEETIDQLRAENKQLQQSDRQQQATIDQLQAENKQLQQSDGQQQAIINQLRAENKQLQQSDGQQQAIVNQLRRELLAKSKKLDNMAIEAVSKIQNTYPDLSATEIIEISVAYLQDCLSQEQSWGAILSSPTLPSKFIKKNKK
jgi:predicted RNase H-like nuclease (RuvC/YqgF family)